MYNLYELPICKTIMDSQSVRLLRNRKAIDLRSKVGDDKVCGQHEGEVLHVKVGAEGGTPW